MWVLAVSGLMNRAAPISSLLMPAATRASTSRSRSVSTDSTEASTGWAGPRLAMLEISVRVTLGDSRASPRATTRMALMRSSGSVSLTRKPLAPARIASKTYSSAAQLGVGDDLPGCLQPVGPRHADVHQHHFGLQRAGQIDRDRPVRGLPDDLNVGRRADDVPETGPDESLVVGEQDLDHGWLA